MSTDEIKALGFHELACVEFHDAILSSVNFDVISRRCLIGLSTFAGPNSSMRVNSMIEFELVESAVCNLDVASIVDNSKSGNVMSCRVDVKKKVVRIYLADGLIEIFSENVSLRLLA